MTTTTSVTGWLQNLRVTKVEVLRTREPIVLPEPWRPAWAGPHAPPTTSFGAALYKVSTNQGIVGFGPYTGDPAMLEGVNPFSVGAFWQRHMSGRRLGNAGKGAAGMEIALWDLVGKAANLPISKLLGACRDRLPVYAATSRLLTPEEHVQQVLVLRAQGFRAVKLRLHRPDPRDDVAVVQAVRDAVGGTMTLLVDANQNNGADCYPFWSRRTALQVAKQLDELGVYYLEEPLPRPDVEGLAALAAAVDMFIAGGEHSPTIYDFREHLLRGAYDIIQPDVIMGGNMGITGLQKLATIADYFGRLVVPHVVSSRSLPVVLAATLHAMATADNCPFVEYPYDPPILTTETTQDIVTAPLVIDRDGCVKVPEKPGLGVETDEQRFVATPA